MKKALKILGITIGGIVALAAVALGAVYAVTQMRMNGSTDIAGHTVPIPTDSASIERGRHVVNAFGMCGDCHGPDFGGFSVIDVPVVAVLSASNLTAGTGGIGSSYNDLDWERAIRHGVNPQGKKLLFMPAHEYAMLNDADFAASVAYLRQLPKVDKPQGPVSIGPIGRVLALTGGLELLPADLMDHTAAHPAILEPAPTVEYGQYLSTTCRGCHGKTFSGGPMPGAPPEWKPPANITPGGIGHYTEAGFFTALRDGKRPDGSMLDTMQMPVRFTRNLTDTELKALYAFLKTLPAKEYGNR